MRRVACFCVVFALALLFVACSGSRAQAQEKLSNEHVADAPAQYTKVFDAKRRRVALDLETLLGKMMEEDSRYDVGFDRYFEIGMSTLVSVATDAELDSILEMVDKLWEAREERGSFVQNEGFPDELGILAANLDALLMEIAWRM